MVAHSSFFVEGWSPMWFLPSTLACLLLSLFFRSCLDSLVFWISSVYLIFLGNGASQQTSCSFSSYNLSPPFTLFLDVSWVLSIGILFHIDNLGHGMIQSLVFLAVLWLHVFYKCLSVTNKRFFINNGEIYPSVDIRINEVKNLCWFSKMVVVDLLPRSITSLCPDSWIGFVSYWAGLKHNYKTLGYLDKMSSSPSLLGLLCRANHCYGS